VIPSVRVQPATGLRRERRGGRATRGCWCAAYHQDGGRRCRRDRDLSRRVSRVPGGSHAPNDSNKCLPSKSANQKLLPDVDRSAANAAGARSGDVHALAPTPVPGRRRGRRSAIPKSPRIVAGLRRSGAEQPAGDLSFTRARLEAGPVRSGRHALTPRAGFAGARRPRQ